jgi:hypothetical protein
MKIAPDHYARFSNERDSSLINKAIKLILIKTPSTVGTKRNSLPSTRITKVEFASSRRCRIIFLVCPTLINVPEPAIAKRRLCLVGSKPTGKVLRGGSEVIAMELLQPVNFF